MLVAIQNERVMHRRLVTIDRRRIFFRSAISFREIKAEQPNIH